jgi:4-amino-4-deoxy-L-arabinose transferase-like glycosyltransferase
LPAIRIPQGVRPSPPKVSRPLLLLLLAGVLYLIALGSAGIHRAQEARVAEVAREMRVSGDWLVPELNANVRLQKPPIAYWAVASVYAIGDRVSEAAARLPSALAALACILLTASLAGTLFGPRAGFLAGAFLATTRIFLQQGRRAETDVPLALCVVLALFAFERGFGRGRASWKAVFFAALGVGFMTKGVPGIAIPLLAAGAWLLWEGRGREITSARVAGGLLLTLAIIAPWYVLVWRMHPDATATFYAETLRRMTPEATHAGPIHYYLYRLPVDLLPWILLLPFAWPALRADPGAWRAARLPIAWAAAGLLFLTALRAKQPHYLVPVAPALAILCAAAADRAISAGRPRWLTARALYAALAVAAVLEVAFVAAIEPRIFAMKSPRVACSDAARAARGAPLVLYRFSSSPCLFYLRRTAPVAATREELARSLARHPGALVLTDKRHASDPALRDLPVVFETRAYRRPLILLGPAPAP